MSQSRHTQVEFVLHGLAKIRLLDVSESDLKAVETQLGPIRSTFDGEPDITIKYIDRLEITSPLRYLGIDDAGFTDDALLVMRSSQGARAKIPFEQIGKPCEIICERNIGKVPLLIPILNMTMLSKGFVPLHAAGFTYDGAGALVAGWSKGGKTETLLAFMDRGAIYVGDEWIYLSKDGRHMYGIPEPIRIWDWHLVELPEYWRKIKRRDQFRLTVLKKITNLTSIVIALTGGQRAANESRLLKLLKRQQYVMLPPGKLFGPGLGPAVGSPDKVFFVVNHEDASTRVETVDSQEVATRMLFSVRYERQHFMDHYLKFRFAFPESRNDFIEQAEELERNLLMSALANKPAFAVYHPFPAPIPALFEAIHPLLAQLKEESIWRQANLNENRTTPDQLVKIALLP